MQINFFIYFLGKGFLRGICFMESRVVNENFNYKIKICIFVYGIENKLDDGFGLFYFDISNLLLIFM